MDKSLKNIVQDMIDKGYTEEEIAVEIKRKTKTPLELKDKITKVIVFFITGFFAFFVLSLITLGLIELGLFKKKEIIVGILIFISVILGYRFSVRRNYNNTFKKFIEGKYLVYLLELIFPTILTVLFYILVETKRMSVDRDMVAGFVSFLFFFILILEWIRRKKDKTERAYYFKYLYIGLMLLVFVLGVWYANELVNDYQAPKRTKFAW